MTNLPIDLRNVVINPALFHPMQHIGIEVIVVLQAVGVTTRSIRRALLVAIDTKRTDAKTYPRLGQQNCPTQLTDQRVHVLTTPIAFGRLCISLWHTILTETSFIGEGSATRWIGIEIVIHVDRIHVISRDNIFDNPTNKLAALRQSGIEQDLLVIGHEPFGMTVVDVGSRKTGVACRARPIGVQPSMKLHVPLVALLNQEGHRIKITLRCPSLLPREETAPGLNV